jgi:ribosome-binding protein aMBF1 (putative translation factor)
MSAHTRKHPTKSKAALKREIANKLEQVNKTEDLMILNKVIDKYLPSTRSRTPEEVFGEDWTNPVKKLGRMIQGLRFRENMSQIELAKKLKGVKQSNISAWENGKEPVPEKRLKQMSTLFGRDLKKMMKED